MIPKWTLFWVPNSKIWFQLYTNLNFQPLCWENQPLCTGVHYCALAHYTLLAFIIHREWAGLHARLRFLYALFKGAYHTQWGGIDSEVVLVVFSSKSIFIKTYFKVQWACIALLRIKNNIKTKILQKNPPQKILPKKSSQKISPKKFLQKNSSSKKPKKSKKVPKNFSKNL